MKLAPVIGPLSAPRTRAAVEASSSRCTLRSSDDSLALRRSTNPRAGSVWLTFCTPPKFGDRSSQQDTPATTSPRPRPPKTSEAPANLREHVSWGLPMIGEHFVDDASRYFRFRGVGADVLGERDQGLPQRPTAATRPGRVVRPECGAES